MATLHYTACAPFLEASLKDSDALVRPNAARALGDLRIRNASAPLLAMFAAEQEPPAIQQASLALRMLDIKAAAPVIRGKIPVFTGQTRAWLIQALGTLGSAVDVPLIAGRLDDMMSDMAATEAIQELAGVSFGPRTLGLSGYHRLRCSWRELGGSLTRTSGRTAMTAVLSEPLPSGYLLVRA